MKKQYLLEENEYYILCNRLEELGINISKTYRKIEDKNVIRDDFILLDKAISELKQLLKWS